MQQPASAVQVARVPCKPQCVRIKVGDVDLTVCDPNATPVTIDELFARQVKEYAAARAIQPGWFGVWTTNHGEVVLKPASRADAAGAQLVKGFFAKVGVILGKVQGDLFQGEYRDTDDAGTFELVLKAPKRTAFAGTANSAKYASSKTNPWTGRKIRNLGQDELAGY